MNNIEEMEHILKRSIETNQSKKSMRSSDFQKQNTLVKYENSGKRKMTFYITQKCEGMINQMVASKMMSGEKMDKSQLICQAIENFFRNNI